MNEQEQEYLEREYGDVGQGTWPPVRRRPARRPWIAVALSLVVPGLGHVYAGQMRRGLRLWGVLLALLIVPGWLGVPATFWGLIAMLVVALGLYLYILRDGARRARAVESLDPEARPRWSVYVGLVLFAVTIVAPWVRFIRPFQSFIPRSASMAPTLRPGDHVMARKGRFTEDDIERGDVVIFESPEDPSIFQVYRIAGLPGEELDLVDKTVFVDGEALEEPPAVHFRDPRTYPDAPGLPEPMRARDQAGPLRVPEGHVFVLGDNRDQAYDSRFLGPVPIETIRARPLYVYWNRPPQPWGGVRAWLAAPDLSRVGARIE